MRQAPRSLTREQLARWVDPTIPTIRLRTRWDVLPGMPPLMSAMMPLVVDWEHAASSPNTVLIHRLNAGGNPVAGTTRMTSAVVHREALRGVHFVMTPLDRFGKRGLLAHAMLRFLFDPGGVRLLGSGVDAGGVDAADDMVVSWEAWRAPDVDYDALEGIADDAYFLTARGYTGPQRFLEDGLQKRDWFEFPLTFEGGAAGASAVLDAALIMADSVARRVLREHAGVSVAAGTPPESVSWMRFSHVSYQSLHRSCVQLALRTLEMAAGRDERRPAEFFPVAPMPAWLDELADGGVAALIRNLPRGLAYVLKNRFILPATLPQQLDRAGFLTRVDGKIDERHYTFTGRTPYGRVREHVLT